MLWGQWWWWCNVVSNTSFCKTSHILIKFSNLKKSIEMTQKKYIYRKTDNKSLDFTCTVLPIQYSLTHSLNVQWVYTTSYQGKVFCPTLLDFISSIFWLGTVLWRYIECITRKRIIYCFQIMLILHSLSFATIQIIFTIWPSPEDSSDIQRVLCMLPSQSI